MIESSKIVRNDEGFLKALKNLYIYGHEYWHKANIEDANLRYPHPSYPFLMDVRYEKQAQIFGFEEEQSVSVPVYYSIVDLKESYKYHKQVADNMKSVLFVVFNEKVD